MPIYEYICIEGCGMKADMYRAIDDRDRALKLPCKCGKRQECRFRRIISPPNLTGMPTRRFHGKSD